MNLKTLRNLKNNPDVVVNVNGNVATIGNNGRCMNYALTQEQADKVGRMARAFVKPYILDLVLQAAEDELLLLGMYIDDNADCPARTLVYNLGII